MTRSAFSSAPFINDATLIPPGEPLSNRRLAAATRGERKRFFDQIGLDEQTLTPKAK
jgi:hypothetical protein